MSTYVQNCYTASLVMTNFLSWAQGVSLGMAALGFTKQADTYTANWTSASSIGNSACPTVAGSPTGAAFPTTSASGRAQLSSANFLGAWSSTTSYTAGNAVTLTVNSEPLVYICILASAPTTIQSVSSVSAGVSVTYGCSAATTSIFPVGALVTVSGFSTHPANNGTFAVLSVVASTSVTLANTNASTGTESGGTYKAAVQPMGYSVSNGYVLTSTYWSPYYMEVWKSGGGTPFYVKIEYGCGGSGASNMTVQLGYTYSTGSSGYFTGQFGAVGAQQVAGAGSSTTNATTYMSSDGSNYLGIVAFVNGGVNAMAWFTERQISGTVASAPVYGSQYMSTVWVYAGSPSTQALPASGSIPVSNASVQCGPNNFSTTASQIFEGSTPLGPTFVNYGYVTNPLTVITSISQADALSYGVVSGLVYGTTHKYLTFPGNTPFEYFTGNATSGSGGTCAMRWE